MSFNLKNEKYHLKNDKKWSCIAGLTKFLFWVEIISSFILISKVCINAIDFSIDFSLHLNKDMDSLFRVQCKNSFNENSR